MEAVYTIVHCPECGRALDAHMYCLFTGLGPSRVECPKCGCAFESKRKEWNDLHWMGKLRFFALSVFYALILGLTGGIFWVLTGPEGFAPPETSSPDPFALLKMLPGIVGVVIAIAAVQIYRIITSLRRQRETDQASFRATFWNLQLNVQLKMGIVLIGGFVLVTLLRQAIEHFFTV